MPGGNIWYTRLLMEREMWDQLQSHDRSRLAGPQRPHRALVSEANSNTQYWWHRGETSPERAPDPSNAGGQQ
jgi:hypothetical protein